MIRRALRLVLLAVVGVPVVLVAGAFLYLRQSLPQLEGELALPGLGARVEILRDREGIPHVFAAHERDAHFALGFLHAQDRLWQMELQRRVASGRLSEVLGERTFDTDRLMRTLGIARAAERIAEKLDPPTVASLEAYARGVNAFLDGEPVLPVEFLAMRVKPEPWRVEDSLGWMLVMAWDLSGNWRNELARLRLAGKLSPGQLAQFLGPYPGDGTAPLPDFRALYPPVEDAARRLLAASPDPGEAHGSNNWALAGARTASGKPLLANDPHLGLQVPAIWYFAHLESPQGKVVGATLPGLPYVVLGRNASLAWSMTTTLGDTQDLFVERLSPKRPDHYDTPQGPRPFVMREEAVRVGTQVRRFVVRETRHGPVISDAVASAAGSAPKGYVLALAWAALDEGNATARAGLEMNRAINAPDFVQSLQDFHAPQQTLVYADRDGRVGFVAPARVPLRRADNEAMGRVPVPGWDAKYDWQGFAPFERLPRAVDPPSGAIVTANQRIVPPDFEPFMTTDWMPPYRANRIAALLAGQAKHDMASMRRIQGDAESALARALMPVFLGAAPGTEAGRRALALARGWDGVMRVDSPAPLVFAAWYRELTRLVYADELGELFADFWDQRAAFMIAVMTGGASAWCDDVNTPAVETCPQLAARAMDLAAADLAKRYGAESGWRWGDAHVAASDHRPFGAVPQLARWFNLPVATPGDTYSVNVGHNHIRDDARPFANRHAASLRAIYDFADLDRSLFMHSTGQSGNRLSPWYGNFVARWAAVDYITIPTAREAIAEPRRLVLAPGPRAP